MGLLIVTSLCAMLSGLVASSFLDFFRRLVDFLDFADFSCFPPFSFTLRSLHVCRANCSPPVASGGRTEHVRRGEPDSTIFGDIQDGFEC
jgi:hypothetical protein